MFIGPWAATYNWHCCHQAGFTGAGDNLHRVELDSRAASLSPRWQELLEACQQARKPAAAPLGEVLVFDALYEAYPNLAKLPVNCLPKSEAKDTSLAWVSPDLSSSYVLERLKQRSDDLETVLHEAQHQVQAIEGFSAGSSVETEFQRLAVKWQFFLKRGDRLLYRNQHAQEVYSFPERRRQRLIDYAITVQERPAVFSDPERPSSTKSPACYSFLCNLQAAAKLNYLDCAGEVEARATEARRTWTPQQRKASKPTHAYLKADSLRATGIAFGVNYEPRNMTPSEVFALECHQLRPEKPKPRSRLAHIIGLFLRT